MPIEIIVPEVGEIGMEITFVDWLCAEGDHIESGDALFELDTDKSTVEVQAYAGGRLAGLRAQAGDTVTPRQVIGFLLQDGETAETLSREEVALEETAAKPNGSSHSETQLVDDDRHSASRVRATPRAKALAREHNIELADVRPAGTHDLLRESDIEQWLAEHRSGGRADRIRGRDAVAKRTTVSWQEIPHFHLRLEVDVTDAIQTLRPTTAICAAASRALALHPECNLEWRAGSTRRRETVDLGLAVATDNSLLLATVAKANTFAPEALEARLREVTARARAGQLQPEDLLPRSLTISNLGMFAVDGFDAILSSPDVLLLSVGRLRTVPRWSDGWVPRQVIEVTLATDHRALDGAQSAKLLGTIEELLGEPSRLT